MRRAFKKPPARWGIRIAVWKVGKNIHTCQAEKSLLCHSELHRGGQVPKKGGSRWALLTLRSSEGGKKEKNKEGGDTAI